MSEYIVTTTPEQDQVLVWEVGRRVPKLDQDGVPVNPPFTVALLVQERIDNYVVERGGQFHDPQEVLARLGPAEKARIPADIRFG